jgi:hypothetical protein
MLLETESLSPPGFTFVKGSEVLGSLPTCISLVVAAPELRGCAAEVTTAVVSVLARHVQPFEDHGGLRIRAAVDGLRDKYQGNPCGAPDRAPRRGEREGQLDLDRRAERKAKIKQKKREESAAGAKRSNPSI